MNKNMIIDIYNKKFLRIPIKTSILTKNDNIIDIIEKYTSPHIQKNDIIVISESPLAITQGRAILIKDLKIGLPAKILWKFIKKNPYGIGLRAPESMQCAIEECGTFRILLAAIIGGFTKIILRRSGDFYRIAGKQAALIDAASTSPIPPYNKCVIKGPINSSEISQEIKNKLGYDTAVMDINDIGGSWVIGCSDKINKPLLEKIMKDNPQGQGDELTPICIVRKVN